MMSYIQRLGKSLMLPVSVMPIAALLKGIGYWIDPVGWGSNNWIAAFLIESGTAIIDNLPLLFAVGIAIGMTREKDMTVAICAVVCYLIVVKILSPESVALIRNIAVEKVPLAFKNTANTLVGIIVGLLVAFNYQHFSKTKLPLALSFFSGKRFVPIISTFMMLIISALLIIIWPFLYSIFMGLGKAISGLGPAGAGLYGFFNRLLVSTGLHHALNSVFWFDSAGIDDIGKFWGTISGGVLGITGMYQAGFFPIMMFGLPGAALAMYRCARPDRKKQVGTILFSAAFASFLTGVTEPLEFAFMFIAPPLFLFHAVMGGISFMLMSLLQVAVGNTGGGIIDMFIWGVFQPGSNWYWIIIIGPIYAIIYYNVFKWYFNRKHLSIEVAEDDGDKDTNDTASISDKQQALATKIIEGLGGFDNIITVNNCISRLRVDVKDMSLVNEEELKKTGSMGIVKPSENHIQVIYGPKVEQVANSVREVLKY